MREKLDKEIKILSFKVEKVLIAKDGQSVKALLKLENGQKIETVLISPKPGIWSVCISCQVGCPMNCRFCATGKMGFVRNLTAEEITDQVLFWRQYIKKANKLIKLQAISSVVFMGMGEPFLNWENVRESLKILTDKSLFSFGSRSISVSTSGIPGGIEKLASEFPQVNLAISLHFADDKKRSEFMPVNRKYNLEELRNSLRNYFLKTNRKVFIEYILLEGINDSREDADKLAKYLKSIGKPHLLHVNLIRYNPSPVFAIRQLAEKQSQALSHETRDCHGRPDVTSGLPRNDDSLKPSSKTQTQKFKDYLLQNHINATIRKSLGEEIQGACGQLSGNSV